MYLNCTNKLKNSHEQVYCISTYPTSFHVLSFVFLFSVSSSSSTILTNSKDRHSNTPTGKWRFCANPSLRLQKTMQFSHYHKKIGIVEYAHSFFFLTITVIAQIFLAVCAHNFDHSQINAKNRQWKRRSVQTMPSPPISRFSHFILLVCVYKSMEVAQWKCLMRTFLMGEERMTVIKMNFI